MPWFDHPSYRPVRDALINRFREKAIAFKKLKHIVFLCGAANSVARPPLLDYLRTWQPETTIVFRADDVWAKIAASGGHNALKMEAYLAELADAVIIIVESPGTFAELGAFSNSEPLRKKLLPILDIHYTGQTSFINTGPVSWVNADSQFAPCIEVNLNTILAAATQVTDRLALLPAPARQRIDNFLEHPKHMLFLIRDLIAVIGPATAAHAEKYVAAIAKSTAIHVSSLLGLAESLDLLSSMEIDGTRYHFVRPGEHLKPFIRKKYFNLGEERAKVVAVLQKLPMAQTPLSRMAEALQC